MFEVDVVIPRCQPCYFSDRGSPTIRLSGYTGLELTFSATYNNTVLSDGA